MAESQRSVAEKDTKDYCISLLDAIAGHKQKDTEVGPESKEVKATLDDRSDKYGEESLRSFGSFGSEFNSNGNSSEETFSCDTDSSISQMNTLSSLDSDSMLSLSLCLSMSPQSSVECDQSVRSESEVDSQMSYCATSLAFGILEESEYSPLASSLTSSATISTKTITEVKQSIITSNGSKISENKVPRKKSIISDLIGNQCFGFNINKLRSFRQKFSSSARKSGENDKEIDDNREQNFIRSGIAKDVKCDNLEASDGQLGGLLIRNYPKV